MGNIVSKKVYAYTTSEDIDEDTLISSNTYLYQDSSDKTKLTSVNGEAIVYNSDGLIEDYYGERQLSWEDGKLSQVTVSEDEYYYYQYDVQGNRISKYDSFNEITTRYIYDDDSNLKVELRYQTLEDEQYLLDKIIYEYDSNDSPISFVYESYDEEGEIDYKYRYYYLKNISGDIISIIDEDHNIICKYGYDSYGNCIVTYDTDGFTAESNHLRYRGYYQDDETGFYYLSSRYYDSNIGRFITKDDIEYLGVSATTVSYNLYAYCNNDPVNRIDTDGNFSVEICILIGFAVGVIYSAIDDYKDDHKLNASIGGKTYLENIAFGVVAGYCFGNIGAIIYEAVPTLISFSSSSFTMGTAIGVSSGVATLTSSLTITGADILIDTGVAVAAAGINMVLSKGKTPKMGDNGQKNSQVDYLCKKYNVSKDGRKEVHDCIHGLHLTYKEI